MFIFVLTTFIPQVVISVISPWQRLPAKCALYKKTQFSVLKVQSVKKKNRPFSMYK